MTQGRATNAGGSIYSTGTGVSTISFSTCAADVNYFYSDNNGGFMYIDNS
jgi:hypothetical protein